MPFLASRGYAQISRMPSNENAGVTQELCGIGPTVHAGGGELLTHSGGHRELSEGFGCNVNTKQGSKDPTMTEAMMNLRALLEELTAGIFCAG